MTKKSITFVHNGCVHSIDYKPSQNSKLGFGMVIQTYHYSIEQVLNNELTLDDANCLNCPFSFNQNDGKTGGCYTHKGMQGFGIKSKLRSLHQQFTNGQISEYSTEIVEPFIKFVSKRPAHLCR
jgi:hypothetical protein